MPPSISVIIPAYKARNHLAASLESAAKQTHQPLEILIVNDYSPEPIDDIVDAQRERFPEIPITVIAHEKNQGLGASRNTGIHSAHGEWIALLDHDDIWTPDHTASLLAAAMESGADISYCTVKQFRDDPNDDLGLWGPPDNLKENDMAIELFEHSFITPSASLIRRSILLDIGGFNTDPKVHMCEDLDLWLRLLDRDASFVHVSTPTCFYRKHPDAATSRMGYMAYQSAWVRQMHCERIRGSWLRKRSIVAKRWWLAWLAFLDCGEFRPSVLSRSLWHSKFVPWEAGRGLLRTIRCIRKRRLSGIGEIPSMHD